VSLVAEESGCFSVGRDRGIRQDKGESRELHSREATGEGGSGM